MTTPTTTALSDPQTLLAAARNVKHWMTVNPRYDTPQAHATIRELVAMARLHHRKALAARRAVRTGG